MIPVFLEAGGRVVAPDLFGFGRSDKPVDEDVYTFHFHRGSLVALLEALDLRRVTLVCQDWGGVLGLTIVPELSERFERLIVMNTAVVVGGNPGRGFEEWKAYNRSQHDLAVGRMIGRLHGLRPEEAAAYDAPFPDARYKAGVRRFPELVPVTPEMEGAAEGRAAAAWWSTQWSGPTFMAIGMKDRVLGPGPMRMMQQLIRGCPEPLELPDTEHFVQESGEQVARAALAAFAAG
jgi:haloalkane dehalogenase